MLDEILNVTHSAWFEEGESSIQIVEASLAGDALTLSIDIDLSDSGDYQRWKLECIGYLEHRVTLGLYYEINASIDHVLLWPYLEPVASLTFCGEFKDPMAVVGELYTRHVKTVDHWIPFDRFLNGDPHAMVAGRYGMLAAGPLQLLKAYSEALDSFGVTNGISEPRPALYTNNGLASIEEVKVLTFGRDSYVIASKFIAERLE